jgi:hypothetical protein
VPEHIRAKALIAPPLPGPPPRRRGRPPSPEIPLPPAPDHRSPPRGEIYFGTFEERSFGIDSSSGRC